jgi:hypothetical protein
MGACDTKEKDTGRTHHGGMQTHFECCLHKANSVYWVGELEVLAVHLLLLVGPTGRSSMHVNENRIQAASCCCEHREKVTMLLEWQNVQKQLCKSVRAPQPSAHCSMKMPGQVTAVLTSLFQL